MNNYYYYHFTRNDFNTEHQYVLIRSNIEDYQFFDKFSGLYVTRYFHTKYDIN